MTKAGHSALDTVPIWFPPFLWLCSINFCRWLIKLIYSITFKCPFLRGTRGERCQEVAGVLAEISRSISLNFVCFLLYYCLLHVNSLSLAAILTNLKYWNTVNIPMILFPVIWRLLMEKIFLNASFSVNCRLADLNQCSVSPIFFCNKHFKDKTVFEF